MATSPLYVPAEWDGNENNRQDYADAQQAWVVQTTPPPETGGDRMVAPIIDNSGNLNRWSMAQNRNASTSTRNAGRALLNYTNQMGQDNFDYLSAQLENIWQSSSDNASKRYSSMFDDVGSFG
jgi:hypothetical protein